MNDIIRDVKLFYRTIGALDELSERDLVRVSEINTFEHREYLIRLIDKYDIKYNYRIEDVSNANKLDESIRDMESSIDEVFTNMMTKKMVS